MALGKKEFNNNLTHIHFVLWGKKKDKISMQLEIKQFIDVHEHSIRKQVLMKK